MRFSCLCRYFQYKQFWEMFKLPGENDRRGLRLEIKVNNVFSRKTKFNFHKVFKYLLGCECTQVKTYFTNLNKVLPQKNNISLKCSLREQYVAVRQPFPLEPHFLNCRTSVFLYMCSSVACRKKSSKVVKQGLV